MNKTSSEQAVWFRTICRKNRLEISDAQIDLMTAYVRELLRWNSRVNLISRRDEERVWERHILHSLSLLFHLVLPPNMRYLDLGTGGGLPGIPLKILLPDTDAVLIDATGKKIDAVNAIVAALGLSGIEGRWGRAEEIAGKQELAGTFDVVLARGVAGLPELVKLSEPFLRLKYEEGGGEGRESAAGGRIRVRPPSLVALKGGGLAGEIVKARRRGSVEQVQELEVRIDGLQELSEAEKKIVVVLFRRKPDAAEREPAGSKP